MALYSGSDLIAVCGLSKAQVRRIVESLGVRKIGELRFISGFPFPSNAVPGLRKEGGVWRLDPSNAADFNGWVYPDGRALLSDEFPDAWEAFGTSYGCSEDDGTFNIPALSSFMKFANASA